MRHSTTLFLVLLGSLTSSLALGQDTETAPTVMEAAPTMEAAMEAAAMEEPAVMAQPATMEAPAAMTATEPTAAELAARRERFRQMREAREAARAAEEAEQAAAATEEAAPEPVADVDEVALETPEDELEAMAAEENLEGEDFAEEEAQEPFDPAAAMQDDADLLQIIEETDFEEAHEAMHGEGHGPEVTLEAIFASKAFWASIITFLTLLIIFWALVFRKGKAVPRALEARRREIEEHLAEAQRLKAEAEAKKAEYTERLEALDAQLETLRGEMVRAGELERDRIVAEAEGKAAAIRKDVEFTIQQRMKQLREDLTAEMAHAAVAAAEEVLREQTKPADQQRLAEQYLKSLANVAGSTAEKQS